MLTNRSWFTGTPVLETRSVEEVRALLSGKGIGFDIAGNPAHAAALRAQLNAQYQPSMYFAWLAYGAPTVMDIPPARDVYTVNIGISGSWESRVGRNSMDFGLGKASIGSPGRAETVVTSADCQRVQACIERDAVVRHLALVLDRPVSAAPLFLSMIDLETPEGGGLLRTFQFIARELENTATAGNPIVQQQLQDYLITRLLSVVPHDDRDAYTTHCAEPSPASIRRAVDFIHAHAMDPIGIRDIVSAAGVSGRSLFRHFRAWKGVTPLAYLREVRFRCAREDLQGAGPETTVSAIAEKWGFTNPGRFAREFRDRFGEFPSEILIRRHGPRAPEGDLG